MNSVPFSAKLSELLKPVPRGERNFAQMANQLASYLRGVTCIVTSDPTSLEDRMRAVTSDHKVWGVCGDDVYRYSAKGFETETAFNNIDVMIASRNLIIDVADDDCCFDLAYTMVDRDRRPGTYVFRVDNNNALRTLAYKYSGEKLPDGTSPWICTRLRDCLDDDELLVVCRDPDRPLRFEYDL